MLDNFYGDILPSEGQYCLWTKTDKQHHWVSSLDELVQQTQYAVDDAIEGLYFATASFDDTLRRQANVLGKKCFYLDLDAGEVKLAKHGEEKVYATQREAITAAVQFCKATGLAPSYFVSSGEGVHLYWALQDAVSGDRWTVIAKKLSKLFKQFGLKEDSSVTADSARILRPLGAVHENGNEVTALKASRKLHDFDSFAQTVVSLLDEDEVTEFDELPKKRREGSINSDVLVEGPPKTLKRIIPKCGAMADVLRARGNVEEPYWRAMLGIVKFTVEGDKAAHAMSSGHPQYDKRETQNKLDNWKTGPTTCAEFSKFSKQCAGCEHRGNVKSPITLGYMPDNEVAALPPELQPEPPKAPEPTGQPWDGVLTEGFYVKDGVMIARIGVQRKDGEGNTFTDFVHVPFSEDIFWLAQWTDSGGTGDKTTMHAHRWDPHTKTVTQLSIPASLKENQPELRRYLTDHGINFTKTDAKVNQAIDEFTRAQHKRIREAAPQPKITNRLGMFYTADGSLNCAHGEFIIRADGSIHRAVIPLGSSVRERAADFCVPVPYNAHGVWSGDAWDDLKEKSSRYVQFVKKYWGKPGVEKFQLAISMGLASPLMAFVNGDYQRGPKLPGQGLTISLHSEDSARGKTAAMRAMTLAYGVPAALVQDQNDLTATTISRIDYLAESGTMPVVMDEMGEMNGKATQIASLCSAIANGSARRRAKQGGGSQAVERFALIALMGTNISVREMIAAARGESKALQARVLEINVDDMPKYDAERGAEFNRDWAEVQDCAGALGALIHLAICQLGATEINKLVQTCCAKARKDTIGNTQTERFQYFGLGCAMALQLILKKLDLVMFDWKPMQNVFQEAHDSGVSFVVENTLPTDGLVLLQMALNGLTPHTAVTNTETRRTAAVTAYDEPLVNVPPIVKARHVVSKHTSYVDAGALRAWCSDNKVSFAKILGAAKISGVALAVYPTTAAGAAKSFNLLRGMRGSTGGMVSCYAFDTHLLSQKTGKTLDLPEMEIPNNVVPLRQTEVKSASPKSPEGDAITVANQ